MKSTVYRLILSDGTNVDSAHQNAGEAIEGALRRFRGRTVIECYSGMSEDDAKDARQTRDKAALPGRIIHDIPRHSAYPEDAAFAKKVRHIDGTEPMFDDSLIVAESDKAKARST